MQQATPREPASVPASVAAALGAAVRRALSEDGPLIVACIALTVLGVALRARDLAFPPALTWDEHHFVINARNYLHHEHDWNDHPPLGKLLIAVGMMIYGDDSLGWRVAPLVFGLVGIVLAGAIAARLFKDRAAGFVAAAFVAGDGFMIAYSRTALLDGMLATCGLAVLLLSLRAKTYLGMVWPTLIIGCAANIKLSGGFFVLPVVALCAFRRDWFRSLCTLALAPVVYIGWFMFGLALAREPHGIGDALRATNVIVVHHAGLTSFSHPLTSHWYTWFLPLRPITLRYDPVGPGVVRTMTSLGNPLLWWACDVALALSIATAIRVAVRFARERRRSSETGTVDLAAAVLAAFSVVMLLPWVIGKRDSYIYHYLPTYSFLLVLAGGYVATVYRRARLVGLGFVLVVALVSVFYAPVWAQLPIAAIAVKSRLFLRSWM